MACVKPDLAYSTSVARECQRPLKNVVGSAGFQKSQLHDAGKIKCVWRGRMVGAVVGGGFSKLPSYTANQSSHSHSVSI